MCHKNVKVSLFQKNKIKTRLFVKKQRQKAKSKIFSPIPKHKRIIIIIIIIIIIAKSNGESKIDHIRIMLET